jgi:exopolysaccharide biosynthesis polyprenyl glycosylphosphotransferase
MKTVGRGIQAILEPKIHRQTVQLSKSISREWQWRLFTLGLIVNDTVMVGIAYRLAYYFRFETSLPIFKTDVFPEFGFYQLLVAILIPALIGIYAITGLYNRQNLIGGTKEYSKLFNATTIGMFGVIATGFLVPEFIFARGWLLSSWLLSLLLVAVGRFTIRRIVYRLRLSGYFLSSAILVGYNDEGESLANQLLHWRTSGLYLTGIIDNDQPQGAILTGGLQSLGSLDRLPEMVTRHDVEEIILTSSALSREQVLGIFNRFGVQKDVNVRLSSGLYEIITTGLQVKEFAYVPLVGINKVRMTGLDSVMKLILDYAIVLPGMIFAGPLMLLLSILIKLDSPGPAIYRRRVMGVNGTQFDAFKFRSMRSDGDEILEQYPELKEELARNHKLKDDPRITRVGHFLRKTSLDELPQIFNVIRREMSLVGPRMISPPEMDMYQQYGINLLTVKPGITGLWQVSGRSDISYSDRVRLDMYYVRNWSIWLDLQLLFQTIPAVLFRRGAY